MPKNYPSFIIDRSRRSKQSNHTDDYIVCTDKEVGYIARVYKLNRTQFNAHNQRVDAMDKDVADCKFLAKNYGDVAIVLEVEELLNPPLIERVKIKSLLKKGLKAYLYGEVSEIGETDIEKQIGVVKEVQRLAIAQRDNLNLQNGTAATSDIIKQLGDAADSLEMLKMLYNGKNKA